MKKADIPFVVLMVISVAFAVLEIAVLGYAFWGIVSAICTAMSWAGARWPV